MAMSRRFFRTARVMRSAQSGRELVKTIWTNSIMAAVISPTNLNKEQYEKLTYDITGPAAGSIRYGPNCCNTGGAAPAVETRDLANAACCKARPGGLRNRS